MNIMSTRPVDQSGRYRLFENWAGRIPPDFLETTIDPEEFYDTDGFIIPTIENGKVVGFSANEEAKAVWQSTRPEQIRADIDFLAAMQGVIL